MQLVLRTTPQCESAIEAQRGVHAAPKQIYAKCCYAGMYANGIHAMLGCICCYTLELVGYSLSWPLPWYGMSLHITVFTGN